MSVRRQIFALLCALVSGSAAWAEVSPGMTVIPGGYLEPAFREPREPRRVAVAAFLLDVKPVTNREFLEFVRSHPEWRRSQVKRLFANEGYLSHWAGDLHLGPAVHPDSPVTFVSWFAARAYARTQGKRLPSTFEWEYAAQASETRPDGRADPAHVELLRRLYTAPTPGALPPVGLGKPNYFGVSDLHGLVWEWASDFSTAMVTGDARGDTGLDRQLFCGPGAQGARDVGDFPGFMRYAFRSSLQAAYAVHNLGFRCVKDL